MNYLYLIANDLNLDSLPKATAGSGAINTVISIIIGTVAAIAVIVVIIGGFRYILAQGDPQAVSKAKSTILYALIGLLVAIIAQVIVAFVGGNL